MASRSDIAVRVFGKPYTSLSPAERTEFRRCVALTTFYRHHASRVQYVRESVRRRKVEILRRLGWEARCMACGYDRYIGALDFHHTDHTQKDMSVNRGPIDAAVREAAKCRLLCANCHREAHQHDDAKTGRRRKSLASLPHLEAYLRASDLTETQIEAALRGR